VSWQPKAAVFGLKCPFYLLGQCMETTAELSAWAQQYLPSTASLAQPLELEAITGDAGFRQYYRLNTKPSLIAVYAPPSHENVPAFVVKDVAMKTAGVGVPTIFAVDFTRGFMLQEDLGDALLLPLLTEVSVSSLYDASEQMLLRIQRVNADSTVFPPYDRTLLRQEMMLFPEWFVEQLLGLPLTAEDRVILDETFALLEDAALAQPQVVVHRDYHSRNLLLTSREEGGDSIGVIDFQDAVIGAFTYDLVSLLKDCYIHWPTALVRARALAFLTKRAGELGVSQTSSTELIRWFDLMGLQRHIKVLGIFARLCLRDGKARYLDDLPLVLRYTLDVVRDYAELANFNQWFAARLLPLLPKQSWYVSQTAGD